MPGRAPTDQPISGSDLRRRVRRITAACLGLATIASAALTVNFAWAANDDQGAASSSAADGTTTSDATNAGTSAAEAPKAAAPQGTTPSAATPAPKAAAPQVTTPSRQTPAPSSSTLAAPQKAPAAGNGRSHTQSGGS